MAVRAIGDPLRRPIHMERVEVPPFQGPVDDRVQDLSRKSLCTGPSCVVLACVVVCITYRWYKGYYNRQE